MAKKKSEKSAAIVKKGVASPKNAAAADDRAEAANLLADIVVRTDAFCAEHLDDEYADLCRMLAENLANERPTPLTKGTVDGWVGGIVYTVANVNFLSDPDQTPHMKTAELYKRLGMSQASVQARARTIRELYELGPMDPRLCRRSLLDDNPLVWFVELENGMIDDARRFPRDVQEELVEMGVIPYVHPTAIDAKPGKSAAKKSGKPRTGWAS